MKMNKQEIKELIIIICGLLVLVASVILISGCQMNTADMPAAVINETEADTEKEETVEETVEEPELVISDPTNRDYKGNIEYAKFVKYEPVCDQSGHSGCAEYCYYSYQIFFYETDDNYNEWRRSLIDRYRAEQVQLPVDIANPSQYPVRAYEPATFDGYEIHKWTSYYNKQTILIRKADDTPYGIVERYFEGSNVWQVEFLAAEATVCIEDGPYKIYWNKWIDKNTKYNVLN